MKIEIDFPDDLIEKVIDGIMSNFPEASQGSALVCIDWRYNDKPVTEWTFAFVDSETDITYKIDYVDLKKAFPLIFTDKWPKGCTQPPATNNWDTWENWLCQCDAQDFDAFAQLVCLGEVIYG